MGCEDAQKVKLCTHTSSPDFTPQAINAKWLEAVPDDNATTLFVSGFRFQVT